MVRNCIAMPPMPKLMFRENGSFVSVQGTCVAHSDVSRPPRSIPPLPEKRCDNTIYRPHSPPLTSSSDIISTSAPRHYCHLSARSSATSPSVTRYTTKNLCHDDVITKSAKNPIKLNFVKKARESDCFYPLLLHYFTELVHAYDDENATKPSVCHLDHHSLVPHSASRLPTGK